MKNIYRTCPSCHFDKCWNKTEICENCKYNFVTKKKPKPRLVLVDDDEDDFVPTKPAPAEPVTQTPADVTLWFAPAWPVVGIQPYDGSPRDEWLDALRAKHSSPGVRLCGLLELLSNHPDERVKDWLNDETFVATLTEQLPAYSFVSFFGTIYTQQAQTRLAQEWAIQRSKDDPGMRTRYLKWRQTVLARTKTVG